VTAATVGELQETAAEDALWRLHDRSLVLAKGVGRFALHPLLRDLAREEEGLGEAERRHARSLLDYAKAHQAVTAEHLDAMAEHEEAVLLGMQQARRYHEWEWVVAYGYSVASYVEVRNRTEPKRRALEWQLEAARKLGDRYGEAVALAGLGDVRANLGDVRAGIVLQSDALLIFVSMAAREKAGHVLGSLGIAFQRIGQTRKAITHYEQALAIARDIGDRGSEGAQVANLGRAYAALGESRRATVHYWHAIAIARKNGDRRGEGALLRDLGDVYASRGETDKAIEYLISRWDLPRDRRPTRRGRVPRQPGFLARDRCEFAEATECYEQSIALARATGDRRGEGHRLGDFGLNYYASLDFHAS